ncbi:ATP-dependent RNA helicase dbp9 [Smittium culicis]|uniref:RNA helicase n=1 Tax=Smittium culicis TaxID=133412 RepID=A0A1R1Y1B6_9FUNG|nr:ATP-dependent RNA helicase dbp9 [Smittium culicis]
MSSLITPKSALFSTLDIDDRILKALGQMNLVYMTQVQEKFIPIGLAGKDTIVQARTGSGKTAAYGVVLLNKILRSLSNASNKNTRLGTKSLILVPTLELSEQVSKYLQKLVLYCGKSVSVVNGANNGAHYAISQTVALKKKLILYRSLISEQPEVVVSTPSRVLQYLKDGTLSVTQTLETLVIDEADLILSFGYKNDLQEIFDFLPRMCQHILMSATLPHDVSEFSKLILRNPTRCIIKDTADNHNGRLMQYAIMCKDRDKFFLTYVILKLKLISGKCIIFVNGIDRCYRLKLFLEQFSIRSCVLNSELPINSRYHIVEEFNRGIYDYIIATDEGACKDELDETINSNADSLDSDNKLDGEDDSDQDQSTEKNASDIDSDSESQNASDLEADEEKAEDLGSEPDSDSDQESESDEGIEKSISESPGKQDKQKNNKGDTKKNHYGVVRGIDFKDASVIINFDMPTSTSAYTHRIGRTARGNKRGMSLSFVAKAQDVPNTNKEPNVDETSFFEKIKSDQKGKGCTIEPYEFDMNQIDGLRYRCEDALRSVTKASIREAKIKEIKREIINSDLLKTHFEDKPTDLNFLRHDKALIPTKIKPHLKHIPNYLMPKISSVSGDGSGDILNDVKEGKFAGFVPFNKKHNRNSRNDAKSNKKFKGSNGKSDSKGGSRFKGKRSDPLKSFGSVRSKKVCSFQI